MTIKLLEWNIYEVTSENDLQGVKFRGTLRKFSIEKGINLLVENDEKDKNCVRFAVLSDIQESEVQILFEFIKQIDNKIEIEFVDKIINPVLSKLKVNDVSRYFN